MKEFIVTNPYKLGAYFGHLLGKVYKKTPKKRLNTGEKVLNTFWSYGELNLRRSMLRLLVGASRGLFCTLIFNFVFKSPPKASKKHS